MDNRSSNSSRRNNGGNGNSQNRNRRNGNGSPYKSRTNRQAQNRSQSAASRPEKPEKPEKKVTMPAAGTMLTLEGDDGYEYQYDVLASWTAFETKKRYVIYTDHEIDLDGNEQFYAAICDVADGALEILPLETEQDWELVEEQAARLR